LAFVPDKKTVSDTGFGWTITPAALGIRSPAYVYDVTRKRGVTLAAGKPYDAEVKGYVTCLGGTLGSVTKQNEVLDRLHNIADKFNAELRVFKKRSDTQ